MLLILALMLWFFHLAVVMAAMITRRVVWARSVLRRPSER